MEPTNRAHPIKGMCFQCATDNCVFSVLATRNVLSMRQQQRMCFQSATGNVLGEARCYKECASQKKTWAIEHKCVRGQFVFCLSVLWLSYRDSLLLSESGTCLSSLLLCALFFPSPVCSLLPFSCVLSMSPFLARCMNMRFSTVYPT